MEEKPCVCGSRFFDEGGFGLNFCLHCGLGKLAALRSDMYVYQDRMPGQQSYTRLKRFKKYLCRAMRQQSSCTIPKETWDYLLERRPYRDAKHVQWTLKQAGRKIKRKCYDSLAFLTAALCPHLNVPTLTEREKANAIEMFKKVDIAVKDGPFVSYLFCLEYILIKLGRSDVCNYVNHIQCPKRRDKYQTRLDEIFEHARQPRECIMSRFRKHG